MGLTQEVVDVGGHVLLLGPAGEVHVPQRARAPAAAHAQAQRAAPRRH